MLLTELILSKRGPLAKVWLSAHHERKLTKQQALNVDVEQSVEAILTQDDGPTTLRISGQLMLGVTRIYSRKVQYLLDDCKDTRERIGLAFRPGVVDLPEDQAKANKSAITFTDAQNDYDFFDWTWNAPPMPDATGLAGANVPGTDGNTTSALALKPKTREFGAYNFGRPAAASIFGGSSVSRQPSQDDSSSHLDSHDFSGIDLELDLDMPGGDEVEGGRHVARGASLLSERTRRESTISGEGKGGGMEMDVDPLAGFDPIGDAGEVSFDNFIDQDPEARRRQGSVASSALSTPPPETPGEMSLSDITPRTAARIAQLEPNADKPAKRLRLARADAQLELEDAYFANPVADAAILGEEQYIPADPAAIAMRDLLADPAAYFLPIREIGNQTMIFAGPHDLAPELAELFAFPTNVLRRNREVDAAEDGERAAKRARVDMGEDDGEGAQMGMEVDMNPADDVEAGRRQSTLPLDAFPAGADDSFAPQDPAPDDIIDPFQFATPRKGAAGGTLTNRDASLAPSRAESMARQVQYAEGGDFPLAIFDARTAAAAAAASESQSQSQATPTKGSVVSSEQRTRGGYSKNTGMAMGLLRREIEAIEEGDKVVRMSAVAEKASKRAASTFFFELLVLGTRDCVTLDQAEPFGDIEVRAKDRLWQEISA